MTRILSALTILLLMAGCSTTPEKQASKTKPATTAPSPAQSPVAPASKPSDPIAKTKTAPHKDNTNVTPSKIVESDLWQTLRLGFKLPALDNKRVAYYEHRFTRHPEHFYAMLERARWFLPYILSEVNSRNFPTELALLPAVESGFITHAMSRSSASGLWQFIPSTGRLYKLEQNWWFDGRRDPYASTQAALKFLGELHDRFDGNWFHAIAAYNAGGRTVERAISKRTREKQSTDFNQLKLRRETKDYVPKLIAFRNIILNPHEFGLDLPKMNTQPTLAKLNAGSQIDISLFSQLTNIDFSTLRFLNAAYRRNVTPPNGPHHIYLPIDQLSQARQKLVSLSTNDRLRWAHYRIKKGDVLGRIAAQYNVSVAAIKQTNELRSNLIHPGKILKIPVSGNTTFVQSNDANTRNKAASQLTYRVKRGDTLWHIARRYGVNVGQISKWNQIRQSMTLQPGQKLTIHTNS